MPKRVYIESIFNSTTGANSIDNLDGEVELLVDYQRGYFLANDLIDDANESSASASGAAGGRAL